MQLWPARVVSPPSSNGGCASLAGETCVTHGDGECDDGGDGAEFDSCVWGARAAHTHGGSVVLLCHSCAQQEPA